MFTTGSKLLIGSSVLAWIAAAVYGVAQEGALGTIGMISVAAALSLLAGIINTLAGEQLQTVKEIRKDAYRGQHTTTARQMVRLSDGALLIDTPGMRELRLVQSGEALDDVFSEIAAFAADCRFSDCRHEAEPGCAVRAAIDVGALDQQRLERFRKLQAEDRRNSETVAERRARDRNLGQLYKSILSGKQRLKGGNE